MFHAPIVDLCRSNLKHISLAYHKTPSADLKIQLESAYSNAKEGFLLDKIADLESFHGNNSHGIKLHFCPLRLRFITSFG